MGALDCSLDEGIRGCCIKGGRRTGGVIGGRSFLGYCLLEKVGSAVYLICDSGRCHLVRNGVAENNVIGDPDNTCSMIIRGW